jgi:hypothetical protein
VDGRRGKARSHVPDYFAARAAVSALVVDCRPADRRGPRDLAAFEATRRACALIGWDYRLAGAPDTVATANLRWLSGYRHHRYGVPPVAAAPVASRRAVSLSVTLALLALLGVAVLAAGEPVT